MISTLGHPYTGHGEDTRVKFKSPTSLRLQTTTELSQGQSQVLLYDPDLSGKIFVEIFYEISSRSKVQALSCILECIPRMLML